MAGRPGRSGGHNRMSVDEHIRRGTFNATRHGHRTTLQFRPKLLPARQVPAALIEGLSGPGLDFVDCCWRNYEGWSSSGIVLLREAGFLLTQLEALRGKPGERAAQRVLLSTLAALDIRSASPAPAPSYWNDPGIPQRIK